MADEETCKKRSVIKVFCEDLYIFVKKKMKVKTYYLQDKDSSCTMMRPILCPLGSQSCFRHPIFQRARRTYELLLQVWIFRPVELFFGGLYEQIYLMIDNYI